MSRLDSHKHLDVTRDTGIGLAEWVLYTRVCVGTCRLDDFRLN